MIVRNLNTNNHLDLLNNGTKTHDELETDITTNSNDIATNASNIILNDISLDNSWWEYWTFKGLVDINANDISTNANDISTNANDISTNTDLIVINTSNISDNTDDITINTGNIATNTGNIATNTGNISDNTDDITINTGNIATNTGNISTNTSDINNLIEPSLFNTNTILKADTDNIPEPLVIPTNSFLVRVNNEIETVNVQQGKTWLKFGDNYQYAFDNATSSTTSDVWQNKLAGTTSNLPTGTYRVGWSFECQCQNTSNDFRGRFLLNTVVLGERRQESRDAGSDQWVDFAGFYIIELTGVQNAYIQYCSGNSGNTTSVRRAKMEIWRVS